MFLCKLFNVVTLPLLVMPSFGAQLPMDLTKDFPKRATSPDSEWWQEKLSERVHREVTRMLIIDNGEIVMEYQRDNVEDDEVFNLWSMTKPFMIMFMGMVIFDDQYDIDFNTTLGEIFIDETAWELIPTEEELDFKKNITLWEIFTFRSGLSTGVNPNMDPWAAQSGARTFFTWDRLGVIPDDRKYPNMVGRNLAESLLIHAYYPEEKGQWKYLTGSNILSYVMYEITGMTPLEFATQEVFPHIGIDYAEWDANDDGMASSFSSLRLTARSIAKLGMLVLQKGESSPGKQLIPREYFEIALSVLEVRTIGSSGQTTDPISMGLRFFVNPSTHPDIPFTFGAAGLFGQTLAFSNETGRVVVVQQSIPIAQMLFFGQDMQGIASKLAEKAFNKSWTFEAPPTVSPAPTESPGSGAASDALTLFHMMVAVSVPLIMVWL